MELKLIKPTIKRSTFNLKGKTCNEIVDELNEKFPGHFTAHPKFDIKMNASDKSVKSVTISAEGSIKLPAWPKVKSMGENTQKEWKRFLSKLDKHEEGHRLILLESMAIVADEAQNWYDAKIEKGEVPNGYELDKLYKEEWYGKYYDPPQDKYDSATENGKKEGAWFEASRCD
jgi:uncharacterized protein DUF922